MASLAKMECELIVERTRAGFEVAKALGGKGGRKRTVTDSKFASAKRLLSSGVPPLFHYSLVLAPLRYNKRLFNTVRFG